MFLTASSDGVVALSFVFDSSVVEDKRALCPHRLAVKSGKGDVALVDVRANHSPIVCAERTTTAIPPPATKPRIAATVVKNRRTVLRWGRLWFVPRSTA